ncbi:MAG: hypothetical protein ACRCX2_20925 [Paraclostridium sp.]
MPSSLPSPLAIEPCEATAVVGEVIEIGAVKDGIEVTPSWSTSSPLKAVVVNGTVLVLGTGTVEILAYHGVESASCNIIGSTNTINTKFKFTDMNIGSQVTYNLEFLENGTTVHNNTLDFHMAKGGIVTVGANGLVTPVAQGSDIIFVIRGGKRYGHYVEVSDTMMANEEFEAKIGISKKNKKTK